MLAGCVGRQRGVPWTQAARLQLGRRLRCAPCSSKLCCIGVSCCFASGLRPTSPRQRWLRWLCHLAAAGVWRNGSASDSRSEGWEFESLPSLAISKFVVPVLPLLWCCAIMGRALQGPGCPGAAPPVWSRQGCPSLQAVCIRQCRVWLVSCQFACCLRRPVGSYARTRGLALRRAAGQVRFVLPAPLGGVADGVRAWCEAAFLHRRVAQDGVADLPQTRAARQVGQGRLHTALAVGSRSQAGCLERNTAMDDSIGGS